MSSIDRNNGRPGMNLWTVFVLAQVRMCLGTSYDMLHHLSNNDILLRKQLGIHELFGEESYIFEYQNIYDNIEIYNLNQVILIRNTETGASWTVLNTMNTTSNEGRKIITAIKAFLENPLVDHE